MAIDSLTPQRLNGLADKASTVLRAIMGIETAIFWKAIEVFKPHSLLEMRVASVMFVTKIGEFWCECQNIRHWMFDDIATDDEIASQIARELRMEYYAAAAQERWPSERRQHATN